MPWARERHLLRKTRATFNSWDLSVNRYGGEAQPGDCPSEFAAWRGGLCRIGGRSIRHRFYQRAPPVRASDLRSVGRCPPFRDVRLARKSKGQPCRRQTPAKDASSPAAVLWIAPFVCPAVLSFGNPAAVRERGHATGSTRTGVRRGIAWSRSDRRREQRRRLSRGAPGVRGAFRRRLSRSGCERRRAGRLFARFRAARAHQGRLARGRDVVRPRHQCFG